MAKAYVYYNLNYPHKPHGYHPHCFACAVRLVTSDYRPNVQLETTDFESTQCEQCDCFIKDQIEI